MYLLDKKHELYDDTLATFAQGTVRLLTTVQDLEKREVEMRVAVERLRMLAPADVVVTAMVARSTLNALYHVQWRHEGQLSDSPDFKEARDKALDAINRLVQAIHNDMASGERSAPPGP